jgi:hypothetical protein
MGHKIRYLFLWELESMPERNWGLPNALTIGKVWKSDINWNVAGAEPHWRVTEIKPSVKPTHVSFDVRDVELLQGPMPPTWWAMHELWLLVDKVGCDHMGLHDQGVQDFDDWFTCFRSCMDKLQMAGMGAPDWGNFQGWLKEQQALRMAGENVGIPNHISPP